MNYTESEMDQKKSSFESLKFLASLGSGAYGRVFLCRDKQTLKYHAVKKLNKVPAVRIMRENRILKLTNHPFLISLVNSYQDDSHIFFVMDFANGGDLSFHLNDRGSFTEDQARFFAAEITMALGYLHDVGVIYRDLKLENVLMDKQGHVKLADFGFGKDGMSPVDRTYTVCGTRAYMALEIINQGGYGFPADWWSLGIVIFEMLLGDVPFEDPDDPEETFKQILEKELGFTTEVGPQAEDLIRGLLQKDPDDRISRWDITSHEFFSSVDWVRLYFREVQPPIVPKLNSDSDLSYFYDECTNKGPNEFLNECSRTRIYNKDAFEGFDYIGK